MQSPLRGPFSSTVNTGSVVRGGICWVTWLLSLVVAHLESDALCERGQVFKLSVSSSEMVTVNINNPSS